jgi:hypothetical protein
LSGCHQHYRGPSYLPSQEIVAFERDGVRQSIALFCPTM